MAARSDTDRSILGQRLADADIVVSGRVTGVRDVPVPKVGITEHDPLWREATLAVSATHKGVRVPKRIRVRFPGSTDVAWATAPKLERGQKGVFLLKRDGAVFTALHPADVQPPDEVEAVRSRPAQKRRAQSKPGRKPV
jgi:hypothetical protein